MTASNVRVLSSDPYILVLIGKGAPVNGTKATMSPVCAYKESQLPDENGYIPNPFTILYMNEENGNMYALGRPVSGTYSWSAW